MGSGTGCGQSPTEPPPAPQEVSPPRILDVETQKPPRGKWRTPPFDPRFPNQNQTRNCYQNFLGETWWARLEGSRASDEGGGQAGPTWRPQTFLQLYPFSLEQCVENTS
uniref:Uncharacterized protein n=1 Tax=Spermophilus dauricus TaxID=99837 RepID=A0A8C9PIW7_SPEDA